MLHNNRFHKTRLALLSGLGAVVVSPCVLALPFEINDDLTLVWNNAIVASTVVRARNPDKQLVGFNNAPEYAGAKGAAGVSDDGNLNYRKGDVISQRLSYTTDLELRYQRQYGVFGKLTSWYDYAGEHREVPHGNIANGYQPNETLNDDDFYDYNQFSGSQLLDLYTYGNWDIGQNRLTARLGKQSINWGESLLHLGINAFNPVNFAALGRSTVRQDDAFVPVNRIYTNFITSNAVSLEAFYALDWTASQLPACGTFAQFIDALADPGCNAGTAGFPLTDLQQYELGAIGSNPLVVPRGYAQKPGSSGQFGLSSRYFFEPLNTEFGVYYVNYHATNSVQDVTLCDSPGACTGANGLDLELAWKEDVHAVAVSAATGYHNLAVSAELSQFRDLPAQRNFPELIVGATTGQGIYAERMAAAGPGALFNGSYPVDRTQLLLGGELDLAQTIGISDARVVSEASFQWIDNLPGTNQERLGRNGNWGNAPAPNAVCSGPTLGTENGCDVDGYATDFNWGYRVLATMSVPKPALGIEFQPQLTWFHDMQGYAIDGSQVEGRQVIGASLRTIFQRAFFVEAGRNWFKTDVDYDPARDKDVYFVGAGVVF